MQHEKQSSMWKYEAFLPINHTDSIVTLGEGNTPLIPSNQPFHSCVYLKDETRNPTGSMKDRALSVAISKAKELGMKRTILASTGSAGISASAYAARAQIRNTILVPEDTPVERLIAMHMLGSEIVRVNATIEQLIDVIETIKKELGWIDVSTYRKGNPYQSEAPKTIAYEIFEQLGEMPDFVFVPVGGGGTLSGIWQGFKDLARLRTIETSDLPRMVAVHHANYNSLERALDRNLHTDQELISLSQTMDESLPCIAKNIQHIYCMDGVDALKAIRESGGFSVSVTDAEILDAQLKLSMKDGIFAEPSSTSTIAAIQKTEVEGRIQANHLVVSLITGSGMRETRTAIDTHKPHYPIFGRDGCIEFLKSQ